MATASLDLAPEVLESGDPKNFVFFADQLVCTKPKYAAIVVTARKDGRIVAASTIDRSGRRLTKTLVGKKVAAPWLRKTYASCQKSAAGIPATATWVSPARYQFLAAALQADETVVGYSVPVRVRERCNPQRSHRLEVRQRGIDNVQAIPMLPLLVSQQQTFGSWRRFFSTRVPQPSCQQVSSSICARCGRWC